MTEVQGQMTDLIAHIAHPAPVLARSNDQHAQLVRLIERGDGAAAREARARAPEGHRAGPRRPDALAHARRRGRSAAASSARPSRWRSARRGADTVLLEAKEIAAGRERRQLGAAARGVRLAARRAGDRADPALGAAARSGDRRAGHPGPALRRAGARRRRPRRHVRGRGREAVTDPDAAYTRALAGRGRGAAAPRSAPASGSPTAARSPRASRSTAPACTPTTSRACSATTRSRSSRARASSPSSTAWSSTGCCSRRPTRARAGCWCSRPSTAR